MDISGASLSMPSLYAWSGTAMPPTAGAAGAEVAVALESKVLEATKGIAAQLIGTMANAAPPVPLGTALAGLSTLDPATELARMGG